MLRWIRMLPTAPKTWDINLPETMAHRSVEGSTLILIPGCSAEVTEDEWALIQAEHSDVLPWIETLKEPSPS